MIAGDVAVRMIVGNWYCNGCLCVTGNRVATEDIGMEQKYCVLMFLHKILCVYLHGSM